MQLLILIVLYNFFSLRKMFCWLNLSKKHCTKNHIFHLFVTPKYGLFVSFQHTRKHDIFLSRKRKKKLSCRRFLMLKERPYFLHQKINEKVILMHTLAILENLIFCENDNKSYIPSCAWRSIKNYFTLSPIFLKTFFYILVAYLSSMIRKLGYIFDRSYHWFLSKNMKIH